MTADTDTRTDRQRREDWIAEQLARDWFHTEVPSPAEQLAVRGSYAYEANRVVDLYLELADKAPRGLRWLFVRKAWRAMDRLEANMVNVTWVVLRP